VGKIDLFPNLVNVIPAKAVVTVDIRNTDEKILRQAEKEFAVFLADIANSEGVTVSTRYLARFEPVDFHPQVIELISSVAKTHTQAVVHMPSGAGHDAQMFARVCPSAMIFVPSVEGISHNPSEFTSPDDLALGTNILLKVLLQLAAIKEFNS
jgi:N-carbamoyl-L-amino-acid hydrolase